MSDQTTLEIIDPLHPLATGLRERVVVYKEPKQVNRGKVGPAAKVVAALAGDVGAVGLMP